MRFLKRLRTLRGWILAASLALAPTIAEAVSVQPLVIDLKTRGRGTSEIVRVENTYTTPLPVELRVYDAEYTDTGIRATERASNDLLAFPPQALIAPGRTQTFRIQYVGDVELTRSRHFIVTIAQLPVVMPKGDSTVQILYDFNVVVGVAVPGARGALRIVRTEIDTGKDGKGRPAFFVENTGSTYGYLANGSLRLVQRDAAGHEVFRRNLTDQQVNQEIGLGLVGPGQTRRILAPITLPQTGGTVEAQFTPSRH